MALVPVVALVLVGGSSTVAAGSSGTGGAGEVLGREALHPASVGISAVGINTADRAAVRAALVKRLRPALAAPIGWTGSTSACNAGAPSAKAQAATLAAINFFRAMGRLDPVTLDLALSAQAQKAALMMDANFALDHNPPQSWACWSAVGADAAGQSNLCLGCTGAGAIVAYLRDSGDGNGVVGHRRWVMYPPTTVMGSGSTERANALIVFGNDAPLSSNWPSWVSWPTPEYFPNELEPGGRWSLSASDPAVSFATAKVVVKTTSGTALKLQQQKAVNGYGSNTLVWQISGLKLPIGTTARRLDVVVTGIRSGTATLSRRYSVRLFNPDARLKNTVQPKLAGEAAVGQVLTVKTGTWSPAATSYGYVWYRGDTEIAGAVKAKYTLRAADAGQKITAKVIARRAGFLSGTARTRARTPVGGGG